MSVQTEISRIESAREAIKLAIAGKGVDVPTGAKLDLMPALIEAIEAGGGFDVPGHVTETVVFTPVGATTDMSFTLENIKFSEPLVGILVLLTDSCVAYKASKLGFYAVKWDGSAATSYGGACGKSSWPYIDYYYSSGAIKFNDPNVTIDVSPNFAFIPGEQYALIMVQ